MSATSSYLIVEFPVAIGQALHWWHIIDGDVVASGCDINPALGAGLKTSPAANDNEDSFKVIALVPASLTVVRWHMAEGASEKQAAMAASLEARSQTLSSENSYIVAVSTAPGKAATAVIAKDAMASGLAILQAQGLDPFLVTPAGWVIAPAQDTRQIIRADLGFETILRGEAIIAPDEDVLRDYIIGDKTILSADETALKASLHDGLSSAETLPALNLRSGPFAKRLNRTLTSAQKKILGWIALALLVISLVIPAIRLAKYHSATDAANDKSIAVARPLTRDVTDAESAEQKLDELLVSRNRGNVIFSVPASALFSALQSSQAVSVERLSYRADGTVSAGLSAVRNEDINPVLIALQNAGFAVTATPRTDATGAAKADITVRAP